LKFRAFKTKEVTVIEMPIAVRLAVGAEGAQISDVSITRNAASGTRSLLPHAFGFIDGRLTRFCGWIAISPWLKPSQCFLPLESLKGAGAHFSCWINCKKDSERRLWGDEQPQGR